MVAGVETFNEIVSRITAALEVHANRVALGSVRSMIKGKGPTIGEILSTAIDDGSVQAGQLDCANAIQVSGVLRVA
jgi:hypothetical protein